MTNTAQLAARRRQMLNKVPEVTVYFWIIKILCTTVGESFADYVNETLGFGLTNTTVLFSVALAIALVAQFRLRRYVPGVYWLAVVLISVVGTLLTDNLTDARGVPLWLSSTVFSVLLAAVFGIWYAREKTLSIHSIVTTPREAFYWLTVLVTFALGTALGDWTLELTGWSPGAAILLPLSLILAVLVAWRLGAGAVLCFWLAYILTRPLGANIGDYLGAPARGRAGARHPGHQRDLPRHDPRGGRLPDRHRPGPHRGDPRSVTPVPAVQVDLGDDPGVVGGPQRRRAPDEPVAHEVGAARPHRAVGQDQVDPGAQPRHRVGEGAVLAAAEARVVPVDVPRVLEPRRRQVGVRRGGLWSWWPGRPRS